NGESADALPSYQLAVQRRPSAALWSEIAGVASAVPDSTTVAKALAQAVALAPTDTELRRRYALALAWIGDQPGALAQLDEIIASSPSAETLRARADLERWQGHRRRARADYRRALALDPAFAPARAGL